MRCAVVEFTSHHEEILPTVIHLLNRLGIEPDVYLTGASARRRPFDRATALRYRRRPARSIWRYWGIPFRARRYELLIVNSMEPRSVLERLGGTRTPLLGVMHNTELLLEDDGYRAFFATARRRPVVLGRHIAASLEPSLGPVTWLSHSYFGQPPEARPGGPPTVFAVSGNVEFSRRSYDLLIEAMATLATEGRRFRVRIVGRSDTRDGQALRAELTERGLAELVDFTPGVIDHPAFFDRLAASDFTLPLLDPGSERHRAYFETKLASSIPFAIGLGVPLVLDAALAAVYGVAGCGVTYEAGDLAGGLRRAVNAGPDDRRRWEEALAAARSELLDASGRNLATAIAEVTGHGR
jgi:glycosyltransferase involved in cell wall biosynthesis